MKLFKSLLVAPAALGLMSPLVANATEVNLNDISNYSDVDSIEFANSFSDDSSTESTLLAGGEGLVDSHSHDSSFSETTTASFSSTFAIGAEKGGDTDAVTAGYQFGIGLTTSFTGEDSFNVAIDAGNADDGTLDELDLNDGGDGLVVDGINYTFPLGDKITAFVGDSEDGSLLYSTACVYSGVTDTLDDCGVATSALGGGAGTAAGASIDIGNGFSAALGYTGDGTEEGLLTEEGVDEYGAQLTYTGGSYGASVQYANTDVATFWGLNGYFTPSESGAVPSVSVGYEMGDPAEGDDTTQWFAGFQWDEMGPGTLGAAVGSNGPIVEDADELAMYEVYYSYPVNDSMTVTPLVFIQETAGDDKDTGVMLKTDFSF